ncbi:MAG TPA: ABC transporter substrate-binding protein [Streptosporangiaceae bacterium]|nr:ABC transporter substrate-binding protein [Streptosporangiaceae bacterium]
MRRIIVAAAATTLIGSVVAACGSTSSSSTASGGSSTAASASSCTNASIQNQLYTKGVLTVATDNPVYTPWFVKNKPSNGQGYESAVAYAIAHQLGFSNSQVVWVTEPFSSSYAPGPKKFDFDINEISYTPQRAQAVTFSNSYYDVQQAIVALKGSPIVTHHTSADLKKYLYGDQVGTTGLTYITNNIQPTQQPKVFDTLSEVSAALEAHRIDALITDTPTAQFMASAQLKHAVLVAQFPSVGEHYGLLFHLDNPLVNCVNKAIATLKANGTLRQLQQKYLQVYLTFPTIQP